MGVPTLVIVRIDDADLITSDCDPYDSEFITGERTSEGSTVPMPVSGHDRGWPMRLCGPGVV
jgi:isocitrate lyase